MFQSYAGKTLRICQGVFLSVRSYNTPMNAMCQDGNCGYAKHTRCDIVSLAAVLDRSWKFRGNINNGTQMNIFEAREMIFANI